MAGTGASMLETPSYFIGVVAAIFLVISILIEQMLHWLQSQLQKRKKMGLLEALHGMKNELMILGFISLLLVAFQDNLSKICVSTTSGEDWILLRELQGCPCCLKETYHVTPCLLESKDCGTGLCNCDDKNPTCLKATGHSGEEHSGSKNGSAPAHSARRSLLAPAVDSGKEHSCTAAGVQTLHEECNNEPNMRPAFSVLMLHETHLFIFMVAIGHIAVSVAMILLADWRLAAWRRWKEEDDAHAAAVHAELDKHATAATLRIEDGRAFLCPKEGGPRQEVDPAVGLGIVDEVVFVEDGMEESLAVLEGEEADVEAAGKLVGAVEEPDTPDTPVGGGVGAEEEARICRTEVEDGSVRSAAGAAPVLPEMVHVQQGGQDKRWFVRQKSLAHDSPAPRGHQVAAGSWYEAAMCFILQFSPRFPGHHLFSVMRASFILTHRTPKRFDFICYMMDSMDDDFAKVVGLGMGMWAVIITIMSVSGPVGYSNWWLGIWNAMIVLIVNTKLTHIIRYVTRGGVVHKLSMNVFWYKRPWLLLPVLKLMLFNVSYIFATPVFLLTQFGARSCVFYWHEFSRRSNYFPVPFWVLMVLNTAVFLQLALVTLPLYSVAVQMGSSFKHHMVAPAVTACLQDILLQNRKKKAGPPKSLAQKMSSSFYPSSSSKHGSEAGEKK